MAEVLVPVPAKSLLAVFKSPTSVHAVPFHNSFSSLFPGVPPKHNAAVLEVPADPTDILAVFKSATSVQDVPS